MVPKADPDSVRLNNKALDQRQRGLKIMMRSGWLAGAMALSTGFGLGVTAPALAVDAAAETDVGGSSGALQEIVVTARKRAENIESAPLAITAFSGAELVQQNAVNLTDVAKFTPSLSFQQASYDPFSSQPTLRGQSSTDVLLESEPPIGIYIDGVYVPNSQGTAISSLLDVAQVEVLKGPQGTLYGRNTTGGAISVTTNLPNYDGFSGEATAGGGNFSSYHADVIANMPLISNVLSARVSLQRIDQGGYGEDLANDRRMGNEISTSARAALRFDPTDGVEFVLRGNYTQAESNGALQKLGYMAPFSAGNIEGAAEQAVTGKLISPAFSGSYLGVLGPALTGTATPAQLAIFGQGTAQGLANILASVPSGLYDTALSANNFVREDVAGVSLTGTFDLGGDLSLKSITGFNHFNKTFGVDSDGTVFDILDSAVPGGEFNHQDAISQEFDLNGDALAKKLKYVAGLFYFHSNGVDSNEDYALPTINPVNPSVTDASVMDTSKAIFGQATYTILDGLNFTGGVRETWESKTLGSGNYSGTGILYSCSIPVQDQIGGQCYGRFGNGYNNLSYTASLDYSVTEQTLIYLRSGSGFKAGGQNERISVGNAQFAGFAPEKVQDFETGVKTELLDKRVRFNADYYYTKYRDIQETVVVAAAGGGVTSIIANAGAAHIDGIELEVQALPIDPLLLKLAMNWTRPTITEGAPAFSDGRFENVPPFQGSAAAIYTMSTSAGDAKFGIDYTWQGLVDYQPDNHSSLAVAQYSQQPTFGLLGARVSFDLKSTKTQIAAFGQNLNNKYYLNSALDVTGAGLGYVIQHIGPPRTYGAEITQKF